MAAAKLVTRCPACRTAFRLVADQLRLRQGLVRCGQCETVFDAREHLIEVPVAPARATPPVTAPSAPAAGALTVEAALAHAERRQADARAQEMQRPFDPGYDPGYEVPALDSPTMMMAESEAMAGYDEPDTKPGADAKANTESGAQTDSQAKSQAEPDAGPQAEPHASPNAEPHAEPSAESHAGPNAGPNAESHASPNAESHAGPNAGPNAEPHAEPNAESHAGPNAESRAEPHAGSRAEPDSGSEADAAPQAVSRTESAPEAEPEPTLPPAVAEPVLPPSAPWPALDHGAFGDVPPPVRTPAPAAGIPAAGAYSASPAAASDRFAAPVTPSTSDPFAAPVAPSASNPFAAPVARSASDPSAAPVIPSASDPFGTPVTPSTSDPFAAPVIPSASGFLRTETAEARGDHASAPEGLPPVTATDAPDFTGFAARPSTAQHWMGRRHDAHDKGPDARNDDAQSGTADTEALQAHDGHDGRDSDDSRDANAPRTPGFAPDFLRHTRGAQRQREHKVTLPANKRVFARVAVVVLAVGALLEATYLARSQLAGTFPALRPVLEAACAPLHCVVPPWRDLDALRIDSSQLQKQDEATDVYQLAVTMRNQGRATTALPAIELVMTDLQDQLLLRRVLLPAEYLEPTQRAFATSGLRAGTELPVRVRFRTQQAAANYRVLIFYP